MGSAASGAGVISTRAAPARRAAEAGMAQQEHGGQNAERHNAMQYIVLAVFLLAAAALPAGEFSTYIGDENTWHISRVMVDASGNTYVAGSRTFNLSFDPLTSRPDDGSDCCETRHERENGLVRGIGGKGNEAANDVAVDRAGNIYIAGGTSSPNFPVVNALYPMAPSARPSGRHSGS